MFSFRKSLGFRLLGISIILLALPLLVDSFILMQSRYRHAFTDAKQKLIDSAHLREFELQQIEPVGETFLSLMQEHLNLTTEFPTKENKILNQDLAEFADIGNFYGAMVVKITEDNEFVVVAANREQFIGKNYTNFFNLINLSSLKDEKGGVLNRISYDPVTLEPFFLVAQPVFVKDQKEPAGFLVLTDSNNMGNKLESILAPDIHQYPIHFALLLPSTIVFAASDPSLQFHYFSPLTEKFKEIFLQEEPFAKALLPDGPINISRIDDKQKFIEFKWNGRKQIGLISELPKSDFLLLDYVARADIYSNPLREYADIYVIYLAILVVGTLVAYALTRRMTQPIFNLLGVMQKIQKGELETRYSSDVVGFEINELGFIFNDMVDSLIESKRSTEQERVEKEMLARELKVGQQVQRSLLPEKMPPFEGIELAEVYIPAIEVGGDFFDCFETEINGKKRLMLAIADASGKGVQACFYSLGVRSILRTYANHFDDVGVAMQKTNMLFCQDTGDTGMFITVLMAAYDPETRQLNYFSCGHNPLFVCRSNGIVEVLNVQGAAMGLVVGDPQPADTIPLNEGDLVLFYTDGVTEAHDIENQLFGEDRVMEFLRANRELSSREIATKLVEEITIFVGVAPQHDDITLMVMKVK